MIEHKAVGRPRKAPEPGENKSISFRVSPETYAALVLLSETEGRSIGSSVTRLIEQGLDASRHADLHRTIRETVRAEMRAEFEARREAASWSLQMTGWVNDHASVTSHSAQHIAASALNKGSS